MDSSCSALGHLLAATPGRWSHRRGRVRSGAQSAGRCTPKAWSSRRPTAPSRHCLRPADALLYHHMRLYPAALLEQAHLSAPNARVHARALALALCVSQGAIAADHVKDIVADKWRYLKDSFSTAAISKSVVEVI